VNGGIVVDHGDLPPRSGFWRWRLIFDDLKKFVLVGQFIFPSLRQPP